MITMNLLARAALLLAATLLAHTAFAQAGGQAHYATPEAAAQALIDAAVSDDGDALKAVLGTDADELSSGDPVADQLAREAFVEAAVAQAGIEQEEGVDDRATLVIGEDDWPFSFPLIREEQGWRFDTEAGFDELYARRIGRNELHAIATLAAYVEAQYEYASEDRTNEGRQFAQKLRSSEGKHDGLYWPAADGAPESPMGPLVARAVAQGYGTNPAGESAPFHGYYFRTLRSQGAHAPGGAMSYMEGDRMTRGFAAVAYPAEYGNSGIMTFIVNQQGIVFEKDLGEDTTALAAAMPEYDPDHSWLPVTDN